MANQLEIDHIYNEDCISFLKQHKDEIKQHKVFTLTDIPYGEVNRKSNGLRNLDKENADILTFNLEEFLELVNEVSQSGVIFCGREQFSQIYSFFASRKITTRPIVWEKTNPSPMNGKYIYLSGVEFAVWFKKTGAIFNAFCKNTVFRYPSGRSKLHPTEKNHGLLKDLIIDNSNEETLILDPCCGSGSHLLVAKELKRHYLGIELNTDYFEKTRERLLNETNN